MSLVIAREISVSYGSKTLFDMVAAAGGDRGWPVNRGEVVVWDVEA